MSKGSVISDQYRASLSGKGVAGTYIIPGAFAFGPTDSRLSNKFAFRNNRSGWGLAPQREEEPFTESNIFFDGGGLSPCGLCKTSAGRRRPSRTSTHRSPVLDLYPNPVYLLCGSDSLSFVKGEGGDA